MRRRASLALTLAGLRRLGNGSPTLAEAVERLNRSSRLNVFPLLALLGMVPSPGLPLGAICGTLIVWLAFAELMRWPPRPLPGGLGRRRIPAAVLDHGLRRVARPLRRLEKMARPRLVPLALPVAGLLAILLQGVLMALPIPFGNVPPGIAVILLALALMRHDGIGALLGHLMAAASLAILGFAAWGLWSLA